MKAVFGATDKRIECYSACVSNKDLCKTCPFKGLCDTEEYFPEEYDGINCEGYIPADYIRKGNIFC